MEPKHPAAIRSANAADIEAITEIEKKCFPEPIAYSKRQLKYLLLDANSTSLVESQDGVIRGFVIVTYRRGSATGHVETIDVDPTYKKQGTGLRLLGAAEEDMRRRGKRCSQLEVSEGNEAALKLYTKSGYTHKERIKRYYRYEHNGTRDAIRMVKTI